MAETDSCSRGTMPPPLARVYVKAVAVAAVPHSLGMQRGGGFRSPVLHVVRHTSALQLGAMAQSLAGLPVSALILSSSCGSSVRGETQCVRMSLCLKQAENQPL